MRISGFAQVLQQEWRRARLCSAGVTLVAGLAAVGMTGCSGMQLASTPGAASSASSARLSGRVHGGSQPISGSTVQLYSVGTGGNGSAATPMLGTPAVSDASGGFSITGQFNCPSITTMVYLTATGGNPGLGGAVNNSAVTLMAALGACGTLNSSSFININEVTTVGAVWALQRFMTSTSNVGGAAGSIDLQNAFVNSAMLVNTATGAAQPAASIGDSTVGTINTIANALAACVNTDGSTGAATNCGLLFAATTPSGGTAATDTAGAALNLALNPTLSATPILNLVAPAAPFQPVATLAPDFSLGFSYPAATTFSTALNSSSVFIGDSITAGWPMPINNQGVNAQHAAQISARFASAVLGQGYKRVIILAGTNDVWFPDSTSGYAVNTIISMAQLARDNGVQPVLCLLPPMVPYTGDLTVPSDDFNAQLTAVGAYYGYLVVDYNTPLKPLYPQDSKDGVHPNAAGYVVMEATLSAVVTR